jgi:ethanolaminephosphotransferase
MSRRILLFNMFIVFVGFLTFLFGFFPVKNSQLSTSNGHVPANGSTTLKPSYDRLIFILIDALRADFVFSSVSGVKPGSSVSKIESLRLMVEEKKAFGFIAKAHSPTVTLPRIKVQVS